jgi:hypothetical protein
VDKKENAMKTSLLAAAFLTLLLCPRILLACSCAGSPSPCGEFATAEAVFAGTVTTVENKFAKMENGEYLVVSQLAHVQVDEPFKGVKSTEYVFGSYGTSCDPTYREGQRWLFYASYDPQKKAWFIRACGRSTQIDYAAEDLLYLRALPGSAQKTRVSGVLKTELDKPLMGVKVKLIGERETSEAFTDNNGVYEVYGLAPGKYTIEPEIPLNLKLNFPIAVGDVDRAAGRRQNRIILKEKSCGGVSFYFTENTSLKGTVFSVEGRPMHNVCVRLWPKDKPNHGFLSDCTDEEGRFVIDKVDLGDYYLVANDDGRISSDEPFPAVFYPGVLDKEKATVLTFASGDKLEGFDIHIPSQRPTRTIEGRLLFSDGRPMPAQWIEFNAETTKEGEEGEAHTSADAEGRFTLQVLEGLKGTLRGHMLAVSGVYENCPQLDKLISAHVDIITKPIRVEVNRDYRDVELVFPFPWCAKAKERK